MEIVLFTLIGLGALLGMARIGLFALNRLIFGDEGHSNLMKWGLLLIPPLLLALSLLFIPLHAGIAEGKLSPFGIAGGIWLTLTTATGIYWVIDRAVQQRERSVDGVHTLETKIVRLRKAHIPFAWLQRLGAHNDVYDLEVSLHQLVIPDLPDAFDGYRIGFVSDTHVASFMRRGFYREINRQLMQHEVDLVLFGGDYVTWRRNIPLAAELLTSGLTPPDGIFAVLGNHDYWTDAEGVVAALTARGIRFLENQSVPIERDGATIRVAAIDEIYRGRPDVERALSAIEEGTVTIVVSHHPDIIDRVGNRRIDLLVCGHTHGGQIRFPFFGAVVVPSVHEARYASGFFRQRRTLMYVGRGIGAIPPVRILCRPEAPVFELVKR